MEYHFALFKERKVKEVTGVLPKIATWSGIFEIIENHSPICADKLRPHMEQIIENSKDYVDDDNLEKSIYD